VRPARASVRFARCPAQGSGGVAPAGGARPCPFYHDPHAFRSHAAPRRPPRAPPTRSAPSDIGPGDPGSPSATVRDALDAAFGGTASADAPDAVGTLPAEQPDAEAELRTDLSLWALVFAGGIGSRFWPLSTPERPKPLLALVGERPLIAETVARLSPAVPPSRVLVLTSADIADALHAAIPEVPGANMLVEPRPMGTAAALAWGAQEVARRAGPKSTLVAMHADLAVGYPNELRRLLGRAAGLTAQGAPLVLIGAEPTRPEAGFGYVVPGEALDADDAATPSGAAARPRTAMATERQRTARARAGDPSRPVGGGGSAVGPARRPARRHPGRLPLERPHVGLGRGGDPPTEARGGRAPPPPRADDRDAHGAPRRVARFVEKPAPLLAEELIAAGRVLAHGILVARPTRCSTRSPSGRPSSSPGSRRSRREVRPLRRHDPEREPRARLLERSPDLVVLPGAFDWDDVGHVGVAAARARARRHRQRRVGARAPRRRVELRGARRRRRRGGGVRLTGALVVSRPGLTFVTTLDRAAELNPLLDALPEELRGAGRAAGGPAATRTGTRARGRPAGPRRGRAPATAPATPDARGG
jgi:mannose-1-phosphate guanylyltransferase